MQVYGAMASQMGLAMTPTGQTVGYDPEALYERDGIARVIVNRPAEDAMGRGFCIDVEEGDGDGGDILNELDRLHANRALIDALRWTRKDGGAAVLMLAKDGGMLEAPLNLDRLEQVLGLIAYPLLAISPLEQVYDDPTLPNYGMPLWYRITPRRGIPFTVHESRLLLFGGEPLPYGTAQASAMPWVGVSELEACWEDLQRFRSGLSLSKQILIRKQQAVHAMAGLGQLLAANMEDVVRKRLDLADAARNIFNGVGIDAEDRYEIKDTSLSGIPETVRLYMVALATSARMPMAVLFGEDIKGLGTTGTGELNIYHQLLTQIQERQLRPGLEWLITVLWSQRTMPGKQPQKWRVKFNPLFSPSEGEMADVELKKAQAAKTLMEALALGEGTVLTPDEVRGAVARTEYLGNLLAIEPDSPAPVMPDNTDPTTNPNPGGGDAAGSGSQQGNAP